MPARPPTISKASLEAIVQRPLSPAKALLRIKASTVPPNGWSQEQFRTRNGRALIMDLVAAQRISMAKGIRNVTRKMGRWFDVFIDEVIEDFTTRAERIRGIRSTSLDEAVEISLEEFIEMILGTEDVPPPSLMVQAARGDLATQIKQLENITLEPGAHEALWASSIERVMRERGLEMVSINTSAVQSTVDSSHAATISLLGGIETRGARSRLNSRVRNVAARVKNINDTTRSRMRAIITRGIEDQNLTVAEMAKTLRSKFKDQSRARVSTIARTEMGQAADEGRKQALLEADVVTHISVIGCEAREPGSPQYRGESTCNIENVPVRDVDQLRFHPNHTGTIIPSKFRDEEELPTPPLEVDPILDQDLDRRPPAAPPHVPVEDDLVDVTIAGDRPVPGEPIFNPSTFDFESSSSYPMANAGAKDSLSRYTDDAGNLTIERKALHDKIVSKQLGKSTPVDAPIARMTGGGPASGKSVLFRSGRVELPKNLVTIDTDEIKKSLPEFAEGVKAKDAAAAAFAHEESSALSKRIMKEASVGKRNLFLDGTGDSGIGSLKKKVSSLRLGGHRIVADYVTVDTEIAVQRNIARAARTGRLVPNSFVRGTHQKISEILPEALEQRIFDEVTLWDTNTPDTVIKVMTQVDGVTTIHNQGLWDRFLAKAQEKVFE